jgi:hypothetical protein
MSDTSDKMKHSRRMHAKARSIKRQMRIRQAHAIGVNGMSTGDAKYNEPHRYHKRSGMTCGDSRCAMCGNPRKFFKERTIQEKRMMQDIESPTNGHSDQEQ